MDGLSRDIGISSTYLSEVSSGIGFPVIVSI
jgi:hypothetical protein